uniref:Uncharacterized protein n=1 Tax=Aegilops tauschii TaxID=37682 RepID=M8B712_AEGTA
MALVPVAARSSSWRAFCKELWEALLEELWNEVKEQAMERCLRYLYHKYLLHAQPSPEGCQMVSVEFYRPRS